MGGSGAGIGPSWVDVNGPFWGCFNKGLLLLLLLLLHFLLHSTSNAS